ncbi:hypothetical protein NI18_00585 [Sphingomonas sp. Ant20]|nr:hypothetical protein NI18_00585 [Sphingomonas sp. Ant20]
MNIKFSGVLVGMIVVFAATSASASPRPDAGHYEWRASIQAPRSSRAACRGASRLGAGGHCDDRRRRLPVYDGSQARRYGLLRLADS